MFGKKFFANKFFGGRYWGRALHYGIVLLGGVSEESDSYSYIPPWQQQQEQTVDETEETQPVDRIAALNAYSLPQASAPLIADNAEEISARNKARLIRQDEEETLVLLSMPFIN